MVAVPGSDDVRQRTVEAYGLIDHEGPVERFARVTRVARQLFDVPVATITVFDGDQARYLGAQGFDGEPLPRLDTFCATTTMVNDVMIVPDAERDERFQDLPMVVEDGVRFYAGAPLRDGRGTVLGVLCVTDQRTREVGPELTQGLLDLASWAETELISSHEMATAGRVQASMLPGDVLAVPGWDIAGLCLPAAAVGGDFFDYAVDQGVITLVLGDVMGKGTGAALVGAGVRSALRGTRAAVAGGVDLGVTTTQVARALQADLERADSFATILSAAIEVEDGWLRWVDAGLGLAVVVRADGTVEQLGGEDLPIGVLQDSYWTEHGTTLAPGDRLAVVSDGLLDLLEEPLEWWNELGAMLRGAGSATDLLAEVAHLNGRAPATDDVTVIAVIREPEQDG